MLKKILKYTIVLALLSYAVFAFIVIPMMENRNMCKGVLVYIEGNELEAISRESILGILESEGLDPMEKCMDSIVCSKIERRLAEISIIRECQVYLSTRGYVNIDITCRQPAIRVVEQGGRTYCIDCEGDVIEDIRKALYLPVVTGHVGDSMARNELKEIANAIHGNRFWTAQIEQIHFGSNSEVIIIPRVGDHIIELGKAEDIEEKLQKLYTFYHKGMNTIGWNKYSKLNIEFNEKVICTKRQ